MIIATYKDLDGNVHTLPPQTSAQLNIAFEHIANCGDYERGSWSEEKVVSIDVSQCEPKDGDEDSFSNLDR